MKLTHKILSNIANEASLNSKNYEYRVNRRNGYYAIDVYIKNNALVDVLNCGNAKETYLYLQGIINGARYKDLLKPF